MKKTTKILKKILLIASTIFAVVFPSRIYNDSKYNDSEYSTTAEYYNDLTNINLYPTDIDGVDVKYVDENRFQGFHLTPLTKSCISVWYFVLVVLREALILKVHKN
ncbi:hypothetical protein [Anaerococcus sp. Marseille-Q7828]|uniref:hypothetical protein n=1 Tax=Anaerococcus sp. Marseille-Q7828 TaxID=3036300 RepID=UPI0024AC9F60|nr:hypothetical protein [Anaerococcus sp. Marseille-Q7828]